MSTPKTHLWINVASAVVLCAMTGTGILMKWVLPPGRRGGRGLVWLGENRHFWGDVHFWLAMVMLALVATHLVLHRRWIANCWQRFVGSVRAPATWILLVVGTALVALPLLIPSQRTSGQGEGQGRHARLGPPRHDEASVHRGPRWRDQREEPAAVDRKDRPRRRGRAGRAPRPDDLVAGPPDELEQDLGIDWIF